MPANPTPTPIAEPAAAAIEVEPVDIPPPIPPPVEPSQEQIAALLHVHASKNLVVTHQALMDLQYFLDQITDREAKDLLTMTWYTMEKAWTAYYALLSKAQPKLAT